MLSHFHIDLKREFKISITVKIMFSFHEDTNVCVNESHHVYVGLRPRWPCGTPQTDDSAGLAEALTHVDGAWE